MDSILSDPGITSDTTMSLVWDPYTHWQFIAAFFSLILSHKILVRI